MLLDGPAPAPDGLWLLEGAPLAECGYGRQLASLTRWADRDLLVASLQAAPA